MQSDPTINVITSFTAENSPTKFNQNHRKNTYRQYNTDMVNSLDKCTDPEGDPTSLFKHKPVKASSFLKRVF